MKYITSRFKVFIRENNLENAVSKQQVQYYFEEKRLGWILRYYHADLKPNIDAFYSETFKFISNVIQYKIPFYTSNTHLFCIFASILQARIIKAK